MASPIRIPNLPEAWPYEPRTKLPLLARREGISIPGLEGAWTLEAVEGLALEGDAQGLAFGRGGVRRIAEIVLRPYRRGGLVAKVNAKTYPSFARFRRELAAHRALWEAGFPTVEPMGFAWRRSGLGVEGVFLTRFTEAKPWPSDWSAPLMDELVKALRALSAWGLFAPDLNATNVMWGANGLALLDWDRAAWTAGALLPRYGARLDRSLAKLGAPETMRAALEDCLRR